MAVDKNVPIAIALALTVAIETVLLLSQINCTARKRVDFEIEGGDSNVENWQNKSIEFWNPADGFDILWINRRHFQFYIQLKPPKGVSWGANVVYLFDVFEHLFDNLNIPYDDFIIVIGATDIFRQYRFKSCNIGDAFMAKLATFDLDRVLQHRYISINIRNATEL